MALKKDTALLPPPCGERPTPGLALSIGPGNETSATRQLSSGAIANQAISANHFSQAIRDIVFAGGGFDGEADFNGTSTVLGHAPAAGVYTLTRDIAPSRMQIRAGATVRPAGKKIFARELHLWTTAIIHADGAAGGNAVGAVQGAKGDPVVNEASAVILGGGDAGGPGGAGGTTASQAGAIGQPGENIAVGLGGDGLAGSAGSAGGGPGGAGGALGAAGTVSGTDAHSASLDNLTRLQRGVSLIHGGAGGGGGGGGGANSAADDGGGGGGGGAGGGVIMIAVGLLSLHSWTGRISANGGQGGNGAAGVLTAGNGGAGGGGGGGLVHVLYAEIEGGALVTCPMARNSSVLTTVQSATGANVTAWGARIGVHGSGIQATTVAGCGTVRVIGPEPFVPTAERPQPVMLRPPFNRPARLHAGHRTRR